ncbi:homoserine O-acetyltransferase/O-succinyltransferase family protein, partial [Lactococcus lactis]
SNSISPCLSKLNKKMRYFYLIQKSSFWGSHHLEVLSRSKETGFSILAKKNLREIYLFGHLEYDRETLAWEYERDKEEGLRPNLPQNYFPGNDNNKPKSTWASAASLFFSNWLNYAVYQGTPYLGERLSQHLNEENYDFNQKEQK